MDKQFYQMKKKVVRRGISSPFEITRWLRYTFKKKSYTQVKVRYHTPTGIWLGYVTAVKPEGMYITVIIQGIPVTILIKMPYTHKNIALTLGVMNGIEFTSMQRFRFVVLCETFIDNMEAGRYKAWGKIVYKSYIDSRNT